MKKCPNCTYLWPDEYGGTCSECGAPMGGVQAPQNLSFAYAKQIQDSSRENSQESSMRRGRYDGVKIHDAILDRARDLIVQREEVRYEED